MNPWILAAVCAASAAILACGIPEFIRSLPAPKDPAEAEAAETGAMNSSAVGGNPYPAVAGLRWLRPFVVLVAAAVAGLIGLVVGPSLHPVHLVMLVATVPIMVTLAVLDARTQYLPTRIITPALALVAGLLVLSWPLSGDPQPLINGAIGFLAYRAWFWVLWMVSGTLGFGDVRLAGLLGMITASLNWQTGLYALYAGLFIAAGYALVRLAITRDRSTLRSYLPLGPALIVGAWLGILLGRLGA